MGQFWRWLPRCHQWFPAWVHLWNQWRVLVLWNRWRLVVHHHHHHHYHRHHRHHLMSGPSPLSWRLHRWLGLQLMGQFVAVLLGSNSIRGRDRVVDQLRCQLSRTSCDLGMFQRGLKRDIWRHIPTKMFGYVRSIQRNLIEQEGKWQLLQSVANSCFSCALSTLGLWFIVLLICQVGSSERSWVLWELHCCLFDTGGFWRRPTPTNQASESWRKLSVWCHSCCLHNVVVSTTLLVMPPLQSSILRQECGICMTGSGWRSWPLQSQQQTPGYSAVSASLIDIKFKV